MTTTSSKVLSMITSASPRFIVAALLAALLGSNASAIPYYWDTDGQGTPGFGTASGTWGTSTFWGIDASGSGATANTTITTADTVNFGTATFGLGSGTVGVAGTVSVNGIVFGSASDPIALSGGTQITLGGTTPTITVNNATNTISTRIVNATNNATSGLTKAGTGELVLSGTGSSIAGDANTGNNIGIRLSAGTLTVSGGSLTTATNGKGIGTFSGDGGSFKQTGGTVTVNATGDLIVGWNSSSTFTLSGGTTSAANIRHQDSGAAVITISGTNTTTVGTVTHTTAGGGTDSLTVNLNTGGTLAANTLVMNLSGGAVSAGNHSLNVNFDGGTLRARSTANLIAATPTGTSTRAINVTVKAGGAFFDSSGFTATILQPILHDSALGASPDGGLTLNDTAVTKGVLVLTGANTYTGATTVTAGTLQFAKQTSLYNNTTGSWTAANINVKSGAKLALNVDSAGTNGFTSTSLDTLLTNISVAGSATAGLQSGAILGFDTSTATGTTFTQGNAIADSTGASGGAIGVTKLGAGTLVLDQANTYTGATTVSAGTLQLNGSLTGAGAAVGVSGGTLGVGASANVARDINLSSGAVTLAGAVAGSFTVSGGAASTSAGSPTVTVANFSAPAAGTVAATVPLTITSTLAMPSGTSATLTGGTSFTAQGANLANNGTARTLTLSGGTLALSTVTAGGGASVTVNNPSFETDAGVANSFQYKSPAAITGWTNTGTGAGWGIEQGSSRTFAPAAAPNGTKWAFVQGAQTMSQTITIATAGYYTVSFADVGRAGVNGPLNVQAFFDTSAATSVLTPSQSAWTSRTSNLVFLSPGTHVLNFAFTNALGGDKSSDLDNVTVTGAATAASVNLPATSIAATASSVLDLSASAGAHNLASLNLTAGATTTALSLRNGVSLTLNGDASNNAISATGTAGQTASIVPNVTSPPSLIIAVGKNISVDSGVTLTVQSVISGGPVTKIGGGTLTLTGTNTYAGATQVNAGTLTVNGVHAGGGAYAVNAGRLNGSGTTPALVTVAADATLAGGDPTSNTLNTLTLSGGFTTAANSKIGVRILADVGDTGSLNPTSNSFLKITNGGATTIDPGTVFVLSSSLTLDTDNNHIYRIAAGTGDQSALVSNPIQFDTTGLSNGTSFTYSLSSDGVDGGSLYLNMTPVPEPATVGLFAAAGLLALRVRRSREHALFTSAYPRIRG